jgi:AraC-like DNA-binding protein
LHPKILNALKKLIITHLILFFSVLIFGQNPIVISENKRGIVENFKHLSQQQLFDTAKYYLHKENCYDSTLTCYHLFINNFHRNNDLKQQKNLIIAHLNSAVVFCYLCDYPTAYKYLITAQSLSEEFNIDSSLAYIYNNIACIYGFIGNHDKAKEYYLKALDMPQNDDHLLYLLSNLAEVEIINNNLDNASDYLEKAFQKGKQNNSNLNMILIVKALFYKNIQLYDSAHYYFQLTLKELRMKNDYERVNKEVEVLSKMGNFFFEFNKIDSAIYYLNLANSMANEKKFYNFMSENYLTLAKIEEAKGNSTKSYEYFKQSVSLKDSIFNEKSLDDINKIQRLYEISQTDKKIETLVVEKKVKERTIRFLILIIVIIGIFSLIIFILYFKLKHSENKLFEKNYEIIKLEDKVIENLIHTGNVENAESEKSKKEKLTPTVYKIILDRILTVMNDNSIFCDPDFNLNKLSTLVGYSNNYVSEVINSEFNKNFCSFLNKYRIQEAQRQLSDPEIVKKFKIDAMTLKLGFKSRSVFYDAFKEITGLSPAYYAKKMTNPFLPDSKGIENIENYTEIN